MSEQEFYALRKVMEEMETNPDKTLFLMDIADPGSPYIEVPLGDDIQKDGFLVIHSQGWFIDKRK